MPPVFHGLVTLHFNVHLVFALGNDFYGIEFCMKGASELTPVAGAPNYHVGTRRDGANLLALVMMFRKIRIRVGEDSPVTYTLPCRKETVFLRSVLFVLTVHAISYSLLTLEISIG